MHFFRLQVTILCLIFISYTWLPVETTDFISLISSQNEDFCITNSSSAMYYTTTNNKVGENEPSFLPPINFFCGFEDSENGKCSDSFKRGDWNLAFSLDHEYEPILDVRWEQLPIQEIYFKAENELKFKTLLKLGQAKNFKITLSLTGEEIHLLLCNREDVQKANCYWFALQGWDQKFTALRRCNAGEIKGLYPDGECYERTAQTEHPDQYPLYIDKTSWSQIIIEKNGADFYLKLYKKGREDTILHYLENKELFELKYLLGHRKEVTAHCKVHTNHYIRSTAVSETSFGHWFTKLENNGFCISFLLNTCTSCSMSVHLVNDKHKVIFEKIIPSTEGIWKQHNIVMDVSSSQYIGVKVNTIRQGYEPTENEFWSIDNFRECHKEEYRITQKDKRKFSECRLLTNDQKVRNEEVSEYVPDITCPSTASLGRACVLCSIVKDRAELCKNLKICENVENSNLCYCSSGYTGSNCDKECKSGTYGYLCRNKCGFCQVEGTCKVLDGSCQCNYLFEGETCLVPKRGLYLRNAPRVIGSKVDSCEIQWNSTDYIGKFEPQYYLLQYMESKFNNPLWSDYGKVQMIENDEAIIGNLVASSKYKIRVLISDKEAVIRELNFQNLPYTICNTTCNGWNNDDIYIKATSERVDIEIKLPKDRCDINTYKYQLKNEQGKVIFQGKISQKWFIKGLTCYTKYTLVLISESQTISKMFVTEEGVPSQVREIEMVESTASYIKLRWKKPEYENGNIEKYKVKYQRIQRVYCFPIIPEKLKEMNTTDTSIELNDLESYSVYRVEVYAINRLHSSEGSEAKFETQGLNYFTEDEELGQITIRTEAFERSASIKFDNVQCSKLQGPLTFLIEYHCTTKWCSNTEVLSSVRQSFDRTATLRSLQPYCKYQFNVFFCRNQTNCKIYNNGTFETKSSVPNMLRDFSVIATGKNFISMRWLPPYPPTGKTTQYRITTKCLSCRAGYHKNTVDISPNKCSIWPEYYCYQVNDYVYNEHQFSVEIDAANEGNNKFITVAFESNILVQEKTPEKPYNLSIIWNPNNTMNLSWNHPNRTNGILRYFAISIVPSQGLVMKFRYPVFQERLTYTFKISRPLPPAVDLHIEISTFNTKYGSTDATLIESTYPPLPDLPISQISITNYTDTTITLSLDATHIETSTTVGQYSFILIDDYFSDVKDPNLEILEKITKLTFDETSRLRIVTEINLKELSTNTINFTIGDGYETKDNAILKVNTVNIPLQKARYYDITIILLNEYKGKYRYTSHKIKALTKGNPEMTTVLPEKKEGEEEDASGGHAAYALLLLLLLIPIIIGVVIKRKNIVFVRPTMSLEKIMDTSNRILPSRNESDETIPLDMKETVAITHKPIMKVKPKLSIRKSTNPPNVPTDLYSKPVKMADFEEYVKTSIESGELERQHALFPRGQTQPWQYGSTKINKSKNRYNNLVAYDHSRVILEKTAGDENSDYINANYIHGYNIEKAYIATQGPKSTTLTDFWRMIWQENVRHIVMLANIYEGGKKKVEQYWPNINEELTFQDIIVQYQSMELFANFEYRIFHAIKGDETRKIEQLHFTTWPDHGVPLYPQSLVPFLRKLLKIPLSPTTPIVVHCSAGVGRTGTILLADISLRMAAKQGNVDMLNNLQKLREQRPNMVDNVEQYKLAHLVVLESLMGLRTSIPCNEDMEKAVQKLIRDEDYKIQMNYLIETEWQDQAMKSVAEFSEEFPDYPEKNRFHEIIPENHGRIFLTRYPHDDASSSYINAVQVDAFRCPGRFFITQQPMPNTVGDFWRFVAERKINVIISLNDIDLRERTSCKFWPTADDPELQPVDFILVIFSNVIESEYYDIYHLHVWIKNKHEKEKLDVEIVAFKRWLAESVVPSCCEEFLSFFEEADAISRRSTNVIVTCFDGATASGIYVALCFIIDQMKLEHECDVCLAVRTIRHNRKQFVTNENQFLFLYECAVKFINGFQSYANFQNQ